MGTMIDLSKAPKKTATAEEAFSRSHPDTEIIHLQNYDNFYSLMDRLHQRDMSGQGCRQFLLIWPAVSRVLETPTEFGKLRGWCLRHGYQAALIIPKDDVSRIMAAEQGLPAFSTIAEAGKADWEIRDSLPEADEDAERVRRLMVLKKDHEQSLPVPLSFGSRLLIRLMEQNGYELRGVHQDCGVMMFDQNRQDTHAGGSGCGCSASIICGYFLPRLQSGELHNVLYAATGALLSPMLCQQGESIPGICHVVHLSHESGKEQAS